MSLGLHPVLFQDLFFQGFTEPQAMYESIGEYLLGGYGQTNCLAYIYIYITETPFSKREFLEIADC